MAADGAWRFSVLGPVRGWGPGGELELGSPQQRELLALLVMRPGRAATAEELIDALWGEAAPKGALSTVRTYASRLRRALGGAELSPIVSVAGGYALHVEREAVDALRFEDWQAEAARLRAAGDAAGAARMVHEALQLWQGEPLAGLSGPFVVAARGQLSERRLGALETRIGLDLELGRPAGVTAELAALASEFPLRERFRELQMLALYRCGRKAEALGVYEQTRKTLAEELGVDPSPGLRVLYQRVLAGDPRLELAGGEADEGGGDSGEGGEGGVRGREGEAGGTTSGPPAQLPADVADFTGREVWSRQLVALLQPSDAVQVVVLSGIGGVGKSTLAVHAAHLAAVKFPDGQLFAGLRGTDRDSAEPGAVLGGFLRALGVDPGVVPDTLPERAAMFRTVLAGRRVLIVLDDVWDVEQIRPLLPGVPGCAVLATSRSRLTGMQGARLLELEAFDAGEALTLFRAVAGAERVAGADGAVLRVVGECGYLPLAVRILASRLAARPRWTAETLEARLRDETRRLDELRAGDLAVEATFRLGYEQLGVEQARAFRLIAVPDGPDIGVEAVAALLGRGVEDAEVLAEELVDLCLVESPGPGRYRLHGLLRMFGRRVGREVDGVGSARVALDRLIEHYLGVAAGAATVVNRCGASLVGLIAAPVSSAVPGDPAACMAWGEGEREAVCAVAAQALRWRERERELGPETEGGAGARAGAGAGTGAAGGYAGPAITAGSSGRADVRVGNSAGAGAGADVVDACSDLLYWMGILCQSGQGDQDLARLAALVIDEADRDGNRRAEVIARSQLAQSLSQAWYLDEAHVQATAAVAVARTLPEAGYLSEALSVLSGNHWRAGRDAESVEASGEALRLLQADGAGWEELSEAQLNLAQCLCRVGRSAEACELAETGLGLRRLHGDVSALADSLHATGMVLRAAGAADRAVACHREAAEIHRAIGQRRRLGWSYLRMAEALIDDDALGEALEAGQQAAEILTELGDRPGHGLALVLVGRVREKLGAASGASRARGVWQDAYTPDEDVERWPTWLPRHPVPPRVVTTATSGRTPQTRLKTPSQADEQPPHPGARSSSSSAS